MNLTEEKAVKINKILVIITVALLAVATICIFLPFYDISSLTKLSLSFTGSDIDMGPINGLSAVFGFNAEMDGQKGVLLEFSFLGFIPYILTFAALGGAAGMIKKSSKYDFILVAVFSLVAAIFFLNFDSLININKEFIDGFKQGMMDSSYGALDEEAIWNLLYEDQFGKTLCIVALFGSLIVSVAGSVIKFMPRQEAVAVAAIEEPVKTEETKVEETKVEEPVKAEETKVEEAKVEEPVKAEETKVEEAKAEEPVKAEETKVEEVKAEEPVKAEEVAAGEPADEAKAE